MKRGISRRCPASRGLRVLPQYNAWFVGNVRQTEIRIESCQ